MNLRATFAFCGFVTLLCGIAAAGGDGMPSSFPLPTYHEDGASNVQYRSDKNTTSLQYDVTDDMKDVVAWYRDRLKAQGFTVMMDQEFKDTQGYTRGMVAWSRCANHAYASVQVGAVASGGGSSTPPGPGAEITLQSSKSGC